MSALDDVILGPIEAGFELVGMNTAPMRGVASAAITFGVLHYTKPTLMYTESGEMRSYSMSDPSGTAVPAWAAAGIVGVAVMFLV